MTNKKDKNVIEYVFDVSIVKKQKKEIDALYRSLTRLQERLDKIKDVIITVSVNEK